MANSEQRERRGASKWHSKDHAKSNVWLTVTTRAAPPVPRRGGTQYQIGNMRRPGLWTSATTYPTHFIPFSDSIALSPTKSILWRLTRHGLWKAVLLLLDRTTCVWDRSVSSRVRQMC